MALVITTYGGLRIALTRGERWAALRRSDLTVRWDQVDSVELVAEPIRLVRGLRAPGLSLPWRTKIGTWRAKGSKTFAVTHRGRPGLRIVLEGHDYAEIVLSLPGSARIAEQISSKLGGTVRQSPGAAMGSVERLLAFRSGGVTLAGTVLLPATSSTETLLPATLLPATLSPATGTPVRAAAVVVAGSGELDRDGNDRRLPIGASRQIAETLAASGVATLRYDKRGVGASGGDYLRTGFWDNVDDARSALEALAAQPECVGMPLVVIGHSEGAMIATALAGEPGAVDAAVLLAAPAKTGEQTLIWQAEQIAPTLPKPVRLILKVLHTTPGKQQRKTLDRMAATTTDVARIQGTRVNAKWFRELLAFDPIPQLAAISVPVLAITGDKDLQVDPADLDVIAATVRGPVTVRRPVDLTHILRRDPSNPTLGAYRRLVEQPVDHAVLQDVSSWISELGQSCGPALGWTTG